MLNPADPRASGQNNLRCPEIDKGVICLLHAASIEALQQLADVFSFDGGSRGLQLAYGPQKDLFWVLQRYFPDRATTILDQAIKAKTRADETIGNTSINALIDLYTGAQADSRATLGRVWDAVLAHELAKRCPDREAPPYDITQACLDSVENLIKADNTLARAALKMLSEVEAPPLVMLVKKSMASEDIPEQELTAVITELQQRMEGFQSAHAISSLEAERLAWAYLKQITYNFSHDVCTPSEIVAALQRLSWVPQVVKQKACELSDALFNQIIERHKLCVGTSDPRILLSRFVYEIDCCNPTGAADDEIGSRGGGDPIKDLQKSYERQQIEVQAILSRFWDEILIQQLVKLCEEEAIAPGDLLRGGVRSQQIINKACANSVETLINMKCEMSRAALNMLHQEDAPPLVKMAKKCLASEDLQGDLPEERIIISTVDRIDDLNAIKTLGKLLRSPVQSSVSSLNKEEHAAWECLKTATCALYAEERDCTLNDIREAIHGLADMPDHTKNRAKELAYSCFTSEKISPELSLCAINQQRQANAHYRYLGGPDLGRQNALLQSQNIDLHFEDMDEMATWCSQPEAQLAEARALLSEPEQRRFVELVTSLPNLDKSSPLYQCFDVFSSLWSLPMVNQQPLLQLMLRAAAGEHRVLAQLLTCYNRALLADDSREPDHRDDHPLLAGEPRDPLLNEVLRESGKMSKEVNQLLDDADPTLAELGMPISMHEGSSGSNAEGILRAKEVYRKAWQELEFRIVHNRIPGIFEHQDDHTQVAYFYYKSLKQIHQAWQLTCSTQPWTLFEEIPDFINRCETGWSQCIASLLERLMFFFAKSTNHVCQPLRLAVQERRDVVKSICQNVHYINAANALLNQELALGYHDIAPEHDFNYRIVQQHYEQLMKSRVHSLDTNSTIREARRVITVHGERAQQQVIQHLRERYRENFSEPLFLSAENVAKLESDREKVYGLLALESPQELITAWRSLKEAGLFCDTLGISYLLPETLSDPPSEAQVADDLASWKSDTRIRLENIVLDADSHALTELLQQPDGQLSELAIQLWLGSLGLVTFCAEEQPVIIHRFVPGIAVHSRLELLIQRLDSPYINLIPAWVRSNRYVMRRLISKNALAFLFCSPELKANSEFARFAITSAGNDQSNANRLKLILMDLRLAKSPLMDDIELAKTVLAKNWRASRFFSEHAMSQLRSDTAFVYQVLDEGDLNNIRVLLLDLRSTGAPCLDDSDFTRHVLKRIWNKPKIYQAVFPKLFQESVANSSRLIAKLTDQGPGSIEEDLARLYAENSSYLYSRELAVTVLAQDIRLYRFLPFEILASANVQASEPQSWLRLHLKCFAYLLAGVLLVALLTGLLYLKLPSAMAAIVVGSLGGAAALIAGPLLWLRRTFNHISTWRKYRKYTVCIKKILPVLLNWAGQSSVRQKTCRAIMEALLHSGKVKVTDELLTSGFLHLPASAMGDWAQEVGCKSFEIDLSECQNFYGFSHDTAIEIGEWEARHLSTTIKLPNNFAHPELTIAVLQLRELLYGASRVEWKGVNLTVEEFCKIQTEAQNRRYGEQRRRSRLKRDFVEAQGAHVLLGQGGYRIYFLDGSTITLNDWDEALLKRALPCIDHIEDIPAAYMQNAYPALYPRKQFWEFLGDEGIGVYLQQQGHGDAHNDAGDIEAIYSAIHNRFTNKLLEWVEQECSWAAPLKSEFINLASNLAGNDSIFTVPEGVNRLPPFFFAMTAVTVLDLTLCADPISVLRSINRIGRLRKIRFNPGPEWMDIPALVDKLSDLLTRGIEIEGLHDLVLQRLKTLADVRCRYTEMIDRLEYK